MLFKTRKSKGLFQRLILNDHYATISTDSDYRAPPQKLTAIDDRCLITEMSVFGMLDSLRSTATGLDRIPAWFLRLGAPVFAAPLARLFQQSLAAGVVPRQWKTAVITPIAKIAAPSQASDFRPISITPVLSRVLERYVVWCVATSIRRCCGRARLLTSPISSRSGRPARRRRLSWQCCTPCAQCWLRMTLYTSSRLTFEGV